MAERVEKNSQDSVKANTKVNKESKQKASQETYKEPAKETLNAQQQSLEEKDYTNNEQEAGKRKKERDKKRFNPLNKKKLPKEDLMQIEQYPIRKQAQMCKRLAVLTYMKFKNRGRGDTAVNGMIYASRELIKASRSILQKEVTPKRFYEFRIAKAIFERAKKMSVSDVTFLPYIYRIGDLRRMKHLEEEENVLQLLKDEEE